MLEAVRNVVYNLQERISYGVKTYSIDLKHLVPLAKEVCDEELVQYLENKIAEREALIESERKANQAFDDWRDSILKK